jgi:hypothetical protein
MTMLNSRKEFSPGKGVRGKVSVRTEDGGLKTEVEEP